MNPGRITNRVKVMSTTSVPCPCAATSSRAYRSSGRQACQHHSAQLDTEKVRARGSIRGAGRRCEPPGAPCRKDALAGQHAEPERERLRACSAAWRRCS
jgi:hypothetical protein